jgi:uncharacterized Fe-S cluster-containing radical SAM superfamily protein
VSDAVMLHPDTIGRFYAPKMIAESLVSLAKKFELRQLRVSGGEPTIGKTHLLQLLDALQGGGCRFILETNGIPVATDESYAASLSKYDFAHARVSLKGCSDKDFATLTGAKQYGFTLQLKALQNLIDAGVSCHPSVMVSFSSRKSLQMLRKRLKQISSHLVDELEIEQLILYPHVIRRLRKHELKYCTAYSPETVPPEQI